MLKDQAGEVRGRSRLTNEDEKVGREMLGLGGEGDQELGLEKMEEGERWVETARRVKKAFGRMARVVEE